jgi:hypothetical protein
MVENNKLGVRVMSEILFVLNRNTTIAPVNRKTMLA